MPGSEVTPSRAKHDDLAAGHVFAAVVANTFDNGLNTGVADAEALAGDAVDVGFSEGGSVKGNVADEDVILGTKREPFGG